MSGREIVLCVRCLNMPSTGPCCSAHAKELCHKCYRMTHFAEICVFDCAMCAAEGLPLNMSPDHRLAPGGRR